MSSRPQSSHRVGVTVHVTITIAPENIDIFLLALKPCYDAVIAEPECTHLEVLHSLDVPGVFRFVETWSMTKEIFMATQLAKGYYKPYLAVTEPMWIEPRRFEFFAKVSSATAKKPRRPSVAQVEVKKKEAKEKEKEISGVGVFDSLRETYARTYH